MRNFLRLLLGVSWALACATVIRAADFVWPGHGTIHFDVPNTWNLVGKQAEDVGYAFNAKPKSGAAALLQITLAAKQGMKPVATTELPLLLQRTVQGYLSGSVEKQFSPVSLPLNQGVGYYVHLTDSSLVGQAPQAGNFKAMRNAVAALDPGALVIITMQFDDPDGSELSDMMAMARSMRFDRADSASPAAATSFVFTRPQSKLLVEFPDLKTRVDREGYFLGATSSPQVNVSGWLEPAERYAGMKKFWAKESGGKINGVFGREGDWETVSYQIAMNLGGKKTVQQHLRAELVRDGTWVDLHLSVIGESGNLDLERQLLAVLRRTRISLK